VSPRRAAAAAAAALFAVWLSASVYVVSPSEQAVVLRLGAPLPAPLGPGLHLRPRLLERVVKVETTRSYSLSIGFRASGEAREDPFPGDEELWLTGDTNVVSMQLTVQYQIADPIALSVGLAEPRPILRRVVESALTEEFGRMAVDAALTSGRVALLDATRRRSQAALGELGTGLQLVSLSLRSMEPPREVLSAFQDVQDARSDGERLINEARGFAAELLPRSRGEADTRLALATSARTRRVGAARDERDRRPDQPKTPADYSPCFSAWLWM